MRTFLIFNLLAFFIFEAKIKGNLAAPSVDSPSSSSTTLASNATSNTNATSTSNATSNSSAHSITNTAPNTNKTSDSNAAPASKVASGTKVTSTSNTAPTNTTTQQLPAPKVTSGSSAPSTSNTAPTNTISDSKAVPASKTTSESSVTSESSATSKSSAPSTSNTSSTTNTSDSKAVPDSKPTLGSNPPSTPNVTSNTAPPKDGPTEWRDSKCDGAYPATGLDLAKRMTTMNELCFLTAIWHTYPEARQLTGKVNATPEIQINNDANKNDLPHPLFATNHTELKRTFVGLLSLLWVLKNQHDKFIACQKGVKMTPDQFKNLKGYTEKILKTDEDKEAIIIYTLINDLGKVQEMVEHYKTFGTTESMDHDYILYEILEKRPDLVQSYKALSKDYQVWIRLGMSTRFNFPQLVQGESVPGSLIGVEKLHREHPKEYKRAMELFIVHALYDVAGAAGAAFYNGSFMMSSPVWLKYNSGIEALSGFEDQRHKKTSLDIYKDYLSAVNTHTFNLPFNTWTSIIRQRDLKRATIRICLLCRIANSEDAQKVALVIKAMKHEKIEVNGKSISKRKFLIDELESSGIGKHNATLLYYAPGMFQNLMKQSDLKDISKYVKVGVEKMIQLYKEALPLKEKLKSEDGKPSVYTLDITQIAKEAVTSTNNAGKTFLDKKFKIESKHEEGEVVIA